MPVRKPVKASRIRRMTGTEAQQRKFMLRLYVAGTTPRSLRAIVDAERLCREHLGGRFTLEVIDIYQRPMLARDEQIVAVPTLVRRLPQPLRKLVGDLSDSERVLVGLDLVVREDKAALAVPA